MDHIEPDDVKNILVPMPESAEVIQRVGMPVMRSIQLHETAVELDLQSAAILAEALAEPGAGAAQSEAGQLQLGTIA